MDSSISSSHLQLHRDRRHPRRRLAYVAAVAIMGPAAETVAEAAAPALLAEAAAPAPALLGRKTAAYADGGRAAG